MAYLSPRFEHDIFISFAHRDNKLTLGPRPEDGGWIECFVRHLETWLRDSRGLQDLSIWFDKRRLSGASEFDKLIPEALQRSAILVILHSRNYRDSDYCRKELTWFIEAARQQDIGLAPGGVRRVLNVVIHNIRRCEWTDADHWTRALDGSTGFRIHKPALDEDPNAFCDPLFNTDPAYIEALTPIVDTAYMLLTKHMRPAAAPKVTSPNSEPPAADVLAIDPRPVVFVADIPVGQAKLRHRLLREIDLIARIPQPSLPPPFAVAEHDRFLEMALQEADLSVHLLDADPGELVEGAADHYPTRQAEAGRRSAGQTLIWLPETLDMEEIQDSGHRNWLRQLAQAPRNSPGYQLLRGSPTQLIQDVTDQIERLRMAPTMDDAKRTIGLTLHALDQLPGLDLCYRLKQRAASELPNLELRLTTDMGDPSERWNDFEDLVSRSHDLVLLFGQVTPDWLRARLERALQVIAARLGDVLHLRKIWVVLLPPQRTTCNSLPGLPPLLPVELIDNTESVQITDQTLQALLSGGMG